MKAQLLLVGAIVAACAPAAASSPMPADTSPAPGVATAAHASAVPSLSGGEVLTYRGNVARDGLMPGPGPGGRIALRWSFQADGPIMSSAAASDGMLFFASGDGIVHALVETTGEERWQVSLGAKAAAATPHITADTLVVGDTGGGLRALGLTDGAERWHAELDGPITGAVGASENLIVAATATASAYGVDATTGATKWQTRLPGGVSRSVAVLDGTVYLGAAGGLICALRASDGALLWQARASSTGEVGTPAVAGGLIYAATGIDVDQLEAKAVVAVSATDGGLAWRYATLAKQQVYTPAVVDGTAYVAGEEGIVTALDAATGQQRWINATGHRITALPALADGVLYVATDVGWVYAVDASDGSMVWHQELISGEAYAPIVVDGLVLLGTSRGTFYAIGGD